jgi:hypothetical protein
MNEKFQFSHLEKFPHLKNLDGMEKLENSKLSPLSSLLGLSHTLQMLNGANEDHRFEIRGLYTCR